MTCEELLTAIRAETNPEARAALIEQYADQECPLGDLPGDGTDMGSGGNSPPPPHPPGR